MLNIFFVLFFKGERKEIDGESNGTTSAIQPRNSPSAAHAHGHPIRVTALSPAAGRHPLWDGVGLPEKGHMTPTQLLQQNGRWERAPWHGKGARQESVRQQTPRWQARHGQMKRNHFKTP